MEGLESAEPWKLAKQGLADSSSGGGQEPPAKKLKLDPEVTDIKPESENKENIKTTEGTSVKSDQELNRTATEAALRKLGSEILVTPRHEPSKSTDASRFSPRITPNGDRLNMFNHSQYFNMSISPNVMNGSLTISSKDGGGSPYYGLNIPGMGREAEKPWFNLLARVESSGQEVKVEEGEEDPADFHPSRRGRAGELGHASQIDLLEQKLEIVKHMNHESARVIIPVEKCHGWWKVPDEPMVGAIETSLLQKGTREQNLVINIRKGIEAILESTKKVAPEEINLLEEEPDWDEEEKAQKTERQEVVPGIPCPDTPDTWSQAVALRCEKYLLEQVEALEDKVASASMQVPGWKIPEKPLVDCLSFRPSCLGSEGEQDTRLNPVAVAKQRLLELEAAIERRYLKAPLGQSKEASLANITTQVDKDESMEVDEEEEEEEEGKEENGVEKEPKLEEAMEDNNDNSEDVSSNGIDKDAIKEKDGEEKDKEVKENDVKENDNGNEEDKKDKKDKKKGTVGGVSRGLQSWRDAVSMASNASQLAMAFYILETSIAWDKSIMKASCQFCHGGDNENALLLCDSCDKGYHTYCFKPSITNIPEGDW